MKILNRERPNEKPRIGDLVIRRTRNQEYHPAKITKLYMKGRWKLMAEIEWSNRRCTGRNSYVYKVQCNYNQLTKTRKDYWFEIAFSKVISIFKKKDPWA